MNIEERFDAVSDDYLKFDRVENKRSQRPDLHAFLLVDELFPSAGDDIIFSASRDEILLDTQGDLNNLTDDQVLELVRCGVHYCDYGLRMFT